MKNPHDPSIPTISDADVEMTHRIEQYISPYKGDDLLRDIELNFPGVSYRAFFLAYDNGRRFGIFDRRTRPNETTGYPGEHRR